MIPRDRDRSIRRLHRPQIRLIALFAITSIVGILSTGCGPKLQLTPLEPAPSPVTADSGMVVAAHPLAAEAGVSVLREGGNAVDATLAALFMLNVVEPHASGLGGGGFALVRMADSDARVVNYRERAPRNVDTSFYYDPADTLHLRMRVGGASVCVPGAASGWAALYDGWATMPLERLARDAIQAASEGFVVDPTLAARIADNLEKIAADSLLAATFLKEDILPYEAGDTLRQPNLAQTLQTLVDRGLRSFYRGPIAEAVVEAVRADSGQMNDDDLAFYRAEVVDPIQGDWAGCEVLTIPPPSSGGAALLEALSLFELTGATDPGLGSPEAIHLMSQCLQQAYADAAYYIADRPADSGWRRMLEPEHHRQAAGGIAPETDPGPRTPAAPPDQSQPGNTSHLVVVDRFGNAVSLTQSINFFFGAGRMAGNTGLLLNNQMNDFSRPPSELNLIAPKRRPRSNMTPVILLKNDRPVLVVGTPGGGRIVAAAAQIIAGIVAYDLDISAALDYPRFFPIQEHLVFETRLSRETLKRLKRIGYTLHAAGPYHVYFGGAHGITIAEGTGGLQGAADKRRGGAARGY